MCDGAIVRLMAWRDGEDLLREVREAVFIGEQGVSAELEWDGMDGVCQHVLSLDMHGHPIGCARMLPADSRGVAHIGRMAVLPEWRRKKIGSAMLKALLDYARSQHYGRVELSAQVHAVLFYRHHGFTEVGAEFIEAGLPHIKMQLALRWT
jgi:predicted GNAT family N-acyltransferase